MVCRVLLKAFLAKSCTCYRCPDDSISGNINYKTMDLQRFKHSVLDVFFTESFERRMGFAEIVIKGMDSSKARLRNNRVISVC